ncbi:hypothetical protein GQX74_008914 [Glossina fuscipes]|nr:hypothetical protein GQX74_008914 [Glossina fuscipes]
MEVGVATAATVALLLLLPLFTVVTLEAFGCAVAPPINAVKGKGSCHNGTITIPCNNIFLTLLSLKIFYTRHNKRILSLFNCIQYPGKNKENFCRVSFFAELYKACASGYNVYDDISNLDDSGC